MSDMRFRRDAEVTEFAVLKGPATGVSGRSTVGVGEAD